MRRTRKRRRRLLSTSSARLARRSLTSTSPLLTRVDVVVEIVDAAVEAVVKDEDAAVADAVMVKDVHPTGSAAKVKRVNVAHQGNPGSQDLREREADAARAWTWRRTWGSRRWWKAPRRIQPRPGGFPHPGVMRNTEKVNSPILPMSPCSPLFVAQNIVNLSVVLLFMSLFLFQ